MKTKLLYVLVSGKRDTYLEQAHLSIFSAKRVMPYCHIVLLVDNHTNEVMDTNRRKILENIDEYIVIPFSDNISAHDRSRLLKCGARKYVRGDFLFIDTDTIVLKPLNDIDNVTASIAATRDSHCDFSRNPYREMNVQFGKMIDFPISSETIFYNSGVLYAKDDEIANSFYQMWLDEWQTGCKKGVNKDQPAFAKTNFQMNHVVSQIDDIWNCEFIHGTRYIKDAKILHYLTTNSQKDGIQPFVLKSSESFNLLKTDLDSVNDVFYLEIIDDPFKGIPELTTIISGYEVNLRETWLYNHILSWYCQGEKFYKIQAFMKAVANIKNNLLFWR